MAEIKQPGGRRAKATAAIEAVQFRLVVDMEASGTTFLCENSRFLDECAADAPSLVVAVDRRIKQEGVDTAIPGNVDEPD